MAGLKTEDLHSTLHQRGENSVTLENNELCLEADEDDPDYYILTQEEINESVIVAGSSEPDEYDQE